MKRDYLKLWYKLMKRQRIMSLGLIILAIITIPVMGECTVALILGALGLWGLFSKHLIITYRE